MFQIKEVDCSVINASLLIRSFLFTMLKPFRNLVYDRICLMASNKGMFNFICLNTHKFPSDCSLSLGLSTYEGMEQEGYGRPCLVLAHYQ